MKEIGKLFFKRLIVLTGFMLVFASFQSVKVYANESYELAYDAVDPTLATNPGGINAEGFRGANQVIIYTSNWSGKTDTGGTGTNQYGYEIAVDSDGYIVSSGVNVNIPINGYVISAHGVDNRDILVENFLVGFQVTYDETSKMIYVEKDLIAKELISLDAQIDEYRPLIQIQDSYMYDVEIDVAQSSFDSAVLLYDNLEVLKEEINALTNEIEKQAKTDEFLEVAASCQEKLTLVYLSLLPSRVVESRGVWHRPNVYGGELTLTGLGKMLDELKENNINAIYVETLWHGESIFPSEYLNELPHHALTAGYYGEEYGRDYLKAFIAEAHKRGMEVHSWSHIFNGGVLSGFYNKDILDAHPDWAMETYAGGIGDNFFYDPANPEVVEFLKNYIVEAVSNYDFDGFQLDYIRYPEEYNVSQSNGYTQIAMDKFNEEYGYTGDVRDTVSKSNSAYGDWIQFRQDQVTNAVEVFHDAIREVDKEIQISIAVGPEINNAKYNLMQDWVTWVQNGWIDIIEPMAYRPSPDVITNIVEEMNAVSGNLTYNYAGIAPTFFGLPDIYNAYHQEASVDAGALGTVIFASQNVLRQSEVQYILKNGTNRESAISPHAEIKLIVEASLDDIIKNSTNIYIPKEAMTEEQKLSLEERFNTIKEMPMNNAADYQKVYDALDELFYGMRDYASSYAVDRIREDIKYLQNIIDIKISRYLINNGYWNPEELSTRPDASYFTYPVVEVEKPEVTNENNTTIIIISSVGAVLLLGGGFFLTKKYLT